jgi:hypothetical protein
VSTAHWGDEAAATLVQEHFVTELDRALGLAARDQIGVGLKDREDLVLIGHRLAL